MLIDTFVFYNELDVLELRLRELNHCVDQFVLVEATYTYAGNPKPLYYQENSERFRPWKHKIHHVVVDDMPTGTRYQDNWMREFHQRNAILNGLTQLNDYGGVPVNYGSDGAIRRRQKLDNNDTILLSDVDEIPNTEYVHYLHHHAFNSNPQTIVCLDQTFYYYTFNHRCTQRWHGTKACTYQTLQNLSPEGVRRAGKFFHYQPYVILENAGWHFSHFGGVDVIQQKLLNGAHQEVNRAEWTDKDAIADRIKQYGDLFDRPDMQFVYSEVDDTYPRVLQSRPEDWHAHFMQETAHAP